MVKLIKQIIILFISNFIMTNSYNCQIQIDTLIYSSKEKHIDSKIDTINRYRTLLFDEIRSQNKNIQLVANYQNYLNNIIDNGLPNEENFLLYIYTQKWDSVLNIISKMDYPYKVNNISLKGEDIWICGDYNCNYIILIKKSKFVNNQVYIDILNSAISEEQKDFLIIFIPNYFGNKITQNNIKIKTAFKIFKNQYPQSQYIKYINK
jgi:hypothetical protein